MRHLKTETKMTILTVVALILWFVIAFAANKAYGFVISETGCGGLANDIQAIAQQRDWGKTEAEVLKMVDAAAIPQIGKPDSYVENKADVESLRNLTRAVFQSKYTPEQLAHLTYYGCIQRISKTQLKGIQT